MKTDGMRRALLLAHVFNLLVAIYFIIISIVALVQLRWYHQLTVTIRIRHVVTSATSYFAFLILIFAALTLIIIFIINTVNLSPRTYVSPGQDAIDPQQPSSSEMAGQLTSGATETATKQRFGASSPLNNRSLVLIDSTTAIATNTRICSSIILHLISSVSLIVILVIWLLNTGELVRDSISTQLDSAFAKYQFANRSNHYSVAIDGMQDVNNCCGSLDYTDFPHQRSSGLSGGHYPGSCCGKNMFGVNARVICVPEEILRARQTVSYSPKMKPDFSFILSIAQTNWIVSLSSPISQVV